MSKISKGDFSYFESECRNWIKTFGLKSWEVTILKAKLGENSYAETHLDYGNRCASIFLNSNWDELPVAINKKELKKTALHEVLEILFFPLRYLSELRFGVTYEDIDSATHGIIRSLENVMIDD